MVDGLINLMVDVVELKSEVKIRMSAGAVLVRTLTALVTPPSNIPVKRWTGINKGLK